MSVCMMPGGTGHKVTCLMWITMMLTMTIEPSHGRGAAIFADLLISTFRKNETERKESQQNQKHGTKNTTCKAAAAVCGAGILWIF